MPSNLNSLGVARLAFPELMVEIEATAMKQVSGYGYIYNDNLQAFRTIFMGPTYR